MFFSRLTLNPRSPRARRDLAHPYEMHRTLSQAVGARREDAGLLYRVDVDARAGVASVLLQARVEPDWTRCALGPGYLAAPADPSRPTPETKEREPGFSVGQRLAFRLRANPTFRRKEDGKRLAWLREDDQLAWLARKGEGGGFRVVAARVAPEGFMSDRKPSGDEVRMYSALFDGVLEVTDPEALLATLRSGIGSGKAMGFGLLSVARVG